MQGHPALIDAPVMSSRFMYVRQSEPIEQKGTPAYLAEFLGTLILVLAITGLVSASAVTGLSQTNLALVHALALMGIVYSIGSISGAHVNPAVTLAMLAIRKITGRDSAIYIFMQLLGGLGGALLAKSFFLGSGALVNYGTPGVSDRYLQGGSLALAFLAEAVGAFLLMWAVMGTAVNPTAPKGVAGAAIGGALALGVLIFAPATGASFNPARWFGPAAASGTWHDAWLYILGPIVGAAAAALAYHLIMDMASIPAQTARRGESVPEQQPPVATG
jgi:MIP family channel proteins